MEKSLKEREKDIKDESDIKQKELECRYKIEMNKLNEFN